MKKRYLRRRNYSNEEIHVLNKISKLGKWDFPTLYLPSIRLSTPLFSSLIFALAGNYGPCMTVEL